RLQARLESFEEKVRETAGIQPAPRRDLRCRAVDRWLAEQHTAPAWRRWLLTFFPLPAALARTAAASAAGLALLGGFLAGWGPGGGTHPSHPPTGKAAARAPLAPRAALLPGTTGPSPGLSRRVADGSWPVGRSTGRVRRPQKGRAPTLSGRKSTVIARRP